jgi:hypothetical protein
VHLVALRSCISRQRTQYQKEYFVFLLSTQENSIAFEAVSFTLVILSSFSLLLDILMACWSYNLAELCERCGKGI